MSSTLTYGMVGGGPGAFIGDAHRKAIAVDSSAKLVAGCFSRSPEKTKAQGEALGLEPARCYADYKEMAAAESQREDGIDFVVVVTPNATHYEICKAFLEAGIHVACDKPLATDSAQARELADLAEEKGLLFMVTYTYMGHVTAKYIRDLIKAGEIGTVRTVMAEYPQGWLYNENDWGGKQGEWRCDPARSGRVNCLGDLGTHVENAVATMTGLKIKRVLAKMDVVVPGRKLDDNDQILVEYEGGATGVNWTSQFAIGCDNSLRVRIYGSRGTILWFQENPEEMTLIGEDGIARTIKRGYGTVTPGAAKYGRLPAGHTEGWIEAMGNLYDSFTECVAAKKAGSFTEDMIDYPTVEDGVNGLRYVEACLESNEKGNIWVEL
ncbi:Gfo/Idh/MocA family oxidoreductase [Lachnospiraceae bacterium DSM 108991]|uniref:Gfo/Idh/MocA family oxidoreductase n=1 Tax=Claveliimonas monacensis TaxID=2779351 RepID=A0ABR9RI16_9FIRM|nr:Gfo/Idh/MocA family oxidoreductase [Claveliimonas monacensis]MBE5062604.1 Gfo/Idh/MocA family oxidoreductase [Claveliimonas monacensis]